MIELNIEELKQLYVEEGLTLKQTAQRLGVSLSTVRKRLLENQMLIRSMHPVPVEEIRRLYIDKQLSLETVAKKLGITKQAVHDRLRRAGIERRNKSESQGLWLQRHSNELDVPELLRLYTEENVPISRLEKTFKRSRPTILQILVNAGVDTSVKGRRNSIEYDPLRSLEIGESTTLHLPHVVKAHSSIHSVARYANLRVKVRSERNKNYCVTRIG